MSCVVIWSGAFRQPVAWVIEIPSFIAAAITPIRAVHVAREAEILIVPIEPLNDLSPFADIVTS
tara:strand:- start:54 stop:245 length:192 start_codon:yes stop_codon:yes gene_type:complete